LRTVSALAKRAVRSAGMPKSALIAAIPRRADAEHGD